MNANLADIKASEEPTRFLVAAVLSPDDQAMDASDSALQVLQRERSRLLGLPQPQAAARYERVERAIRTVQAKRRKR